MKAKKAKKEARKALSDERYQHTLAVADAAVKLAKRFGEDTEKAELAGLLHDICKEMNKPDLLQMIRGSDTIEKTNLGDCPSVWHSYAGAEYVKEKYGLDEHIASAIRCHTTGKANMNLLEKIVFLADFISEDRINEHKDEVITILFDGRKQEHTLDLAVYVTIKKQLQHLVNQNRIIHYDSIEAYNYLADNLTIIGE
ncbi:MAG: bis(5'-nucleosyl)-tetraphosphatase (symmetrical) YqeK [Oscillospiraceae bacterium]|nr:bis(5'-nucleosyl)-tetraphosphatase (symmetrical) YqeK [Oscillospiraceae bacterium]